MSDAKALTVDQLIALLQQLSDGGQGALPVTSEGCDCVDDAVAVVWTKDSVMIAREGPNESTEDNRMQRLHPGDLFLVPFSNEAADALAECFLKNSDD